MKPKQVYYVFCSVKGLSPQQREKINFLGRKKGGVFTNKQAAIDFHNKMKATGATTMFFVGDVPEWQRLGHANLADLD